jgi:hypothetical protein
MIGPRVYFFIQIYTIRLKELTPIRRRNQFQNLDSVTGTGPVLQVAHKRRHIFENRKIDSYAPVVR